MRYEHVMIDLETLGTKSDAAFISIGACQFDPNTGEIGETFHELIDWDDALKHGSATGGTLKWWMRQDAGAQNQVCKKGELLKHILLKFGKWFRKHGKYPWGNGATFDITLLQHRYHKMFGKTPWEHWAPRDVRTVTDLAVGIVSRDDFPFEGTQHNALDDAIHQATYVSAMWQALRK